MAAGPLSCLARNDGAAGRGRKLTGAIAAKAIEAQPVFGQIKPLKRPFGAVDNNVRDKETMAALLRIVSSGTRQRWITSTSRPLSVCNDTDAASGNLGFSHRHTGCATGDAGPMT